MAGAPAARPGDPPGIAFDGLHMIERLRLFLMIALGEAVLSTGTAIARAAMRPSTVIAGVAALAVVVALWATYFGGSEHLVTRHIETTTDPIRAARLAMNGQYVVVTGLIAVAVGNELVIAHPGGDRSLTAALLLFGGAQLYLLTQTWYVQVTTGLVSTLRWIACAALLAGGTIAIWLPRLAGLLLLLIVVGTLAIQLVHQRRRESAAQQ